LLQKAIDKNASISDYLLWLITGMIKPTQQISIKDPADYASLKQRVSDCAIKIPKLEREIDALKRDVLTERKEKIENLTLANDQLKKNEDLTRKLEMVLNWISNHPTLYGTHQGIVQLMNDYKH